MTARLTWAFALGVSCCVACVAHSASAQTVAPTIVPYDLQEPQQRTTRFSAYALPAGIWSMEVGFLGVSSDELYGRLGASRGFKHGFQLDLNLLHWAAAVLNANVKWAFFERPHVALSLATGVFYAHGAWLWILDDETRETVDELDLVAVPVTLTVSAPVNRWLRFDFNAAYRFATLFGPIDPGELFYAETEIGVRQVAFRPVANLFVSDATAFQFSSVLPVYTRVPASVDATLGTEERSRSRSGDWSEKVPFSKAWSLEAGVRSRLRPGLFATFSVQYGQAADYIYGVPLFPAFSLEFRL